MSLMKELLEQPPELTIASKYTVLNGIAYLMIGTMLLVWPGATLLSLSPIISRNDRTKISGTHGPSKPFLAD